MNVGSLFSGIGGIELGFHWEGFTTEWFVECEPYAKAVLRKRFPDAVIYDDVTKIDWQTVPKVDILTGGFPCQDISNAGKRAGITGSRSSLWKYYLEAIRVLRPKYALAENVSALTGRGLNIVLADLASIGYDAEWNCIPASAVGANHRRDRIFIIAYPDTKRMRELESLRESDVLANTDSDGSQGTCDEKNGWSENGLNAWSQSTSMADSECIGSQEQGQPEQSLYTAQNRNGETDWLDNDGWWATEPYVGRVANGVPSRVDRIKCLGNAVVPQVAQVIAQAIKDVGGKQE